MPAAIAPTCIQATGLRLAAERGPAVALCDPRHRVMWLNDERVFYAGLLGTLSQRTAGAWNIYVALGRPIRIALGDGPWTSTDLAVLPPYQPHRVACDERLLVDLVIEPESIDPDQLPGWLRHGCGAVGKGDKFVQRVRQMHAWLCTPGPHPSLTTADVDTFLFGASLAPRPLDARIEAAVRQIRGDPAAAAQAHEFAARAGLSVSRFLHLFKQETGTSFRDLRAWKRARNLLHHVHREASLLDVALDTGYPDSTHFSHTIRQMYGLRPRDIIAGSRRLTVLDAARG